MGIPEPNCPQCRERMERGFVLDRGHRDKKHFGEWVAGTPEKGFLFGLKTKDMKKHTVLAFRCPRCGLLQEYAF